MVNPAAIEDLFRQRQLTREVLRQWFPIAVWGHGKIPIKKVTAETGAAVDPVAWAMRGTPQANLNLLGQLTPSTIDFDLDVRLTRDAHLRPLEWSDDEKRLAEEWFYKPFREEIRHITGDTRNHWGRASIGGTGHWLIRLAPDDTLSLDERRGRLKQLGFSAGVGPFTVKLEVRFPVRAASQLFAVLPGSVHDDGDHVAFYNAPDKRDPTLKDIELQPLAQAVYAAALRMVTAPFVEEGERHNTALLLSGVLRRELEASERAGGTFREDEAWRIYETIFAHDTELRHRTALFKADLAKEDATHLPGYPALGKYIGEETAFALAKMLHGYDQAPVERMRERLVFIGEKGSNVIDLEQRTGGGELTLFSRPDLMAIFLPEFVQIGKKRTPVFNIVQGMKSQKRADGVVSIPGVEQGAFLYESPGGTLTLMRQSDQDRSLINRSRGWVTPYVDEELSSEAIDDLDRMLGWFTANPAHATKIKQMIAFKVQHPLIKPQFAFAMTGGGGIGKSTFFKQVLGAVLGASVKTSSIEAVFGSYVFSSMKGASLLVIEEADKIPDFSLSKQLHREPILDINEKWGTKGPQWCFGIPIYLTNKAEPKLNEPGAIDRTLYIVQAPTQYSLNLTSTEWLAYQQQRVGELQAIRNKLVPGSPYLLALRQYFEEFPVTLAQLTDTSTSDSRDEEFRQYDISPEQEAFRAMLARGYIHHEHTTWSFDAPFTKAAFNEGFNELYLRFSEHRAAPLSNELLVKRLREMLGGDLGKHEVRMLKDKGRVYWFPVKLGTLRERFAKIQGVPLADETEAAFGPNEPSIELCKQAWEKWAPKGGLAERSGF